MAARPLPDKDASRNEPLSPASVAATSPSRITTRGAPGTEGTAGTEVASLTAGGVARGHGESRQCLRVRYGIAERLHRAQQRGDVLRRQGPREEEALAELAAHLPQRLHLGELLDTLRDRLQAQAAPELGDGADELGAVRLGRHLLDEG